MERMLDLKGRWLLLGEIGEGKVPFLVEIIGDDEDKRGQRKAKGASLGNSNGTPFGEDPRQGKEREEEKQ